MQMLTMRYKDQVNRTGSNGFVELLPALQLAPEATEAEKLFKDEIVSNDDAVVTQKV